MTSTNDHRGLFQCYFCLLHNQQRNSNTIAAQLLVFFQVKKIITNWQVTQESIAEVHLQSAWPVKMPMFRLHPHIFNVWRFILILWSFVTVQSFLKLADELDAHLFFRIKSVHDLQIKRHYCYKRVRHCTNVTLRVIRTVNTGFPRNLGNEIPWLFHDIQWPN